MNLGSDDNRGVFFFGVGGWVGVWDGVFWREKEETDEMTGKRSRLKQNIRRRSVWMKCRFLQKLWNQAPASSHTHTLISPFWTRRDVICRIWKVAEEGSDCSPSTNAGILPFCRNISSRAHYYISLEAARTLCGSRFRDAKTDNASKWCPSLSDLMLSCGLLHVNTQTASHNRPTNSEINPLALISWTNLFRTKLCLKHIQ